MLFKTDAEKAFKVETYLSPEMDAAIKLWEQMESGKPPWLQDSDGRTVTFWNTIAEEWAKLITQNIDIKVQGIRSGEMPEKMQGIIDKYFLKNARDNIHAMVFWGGIMAKWDGEGIEFLKPNMFLPAEYDSSGEIKAAIFFSYYQADKKFYTKAEWHRFETETKDGVSTRIYHVSTKAFRSDNQDDIGREVRLSETKWKDIEPEFWAENLEKPLFRYIKCPVYNFVDSDSPMGVPCFANCTEELRWLDIAMSTMGTETENSTPMMMVDQSVIQYATMNGIQLPKFIMNTGIDLSGDGSKPVEQWQPQLQVTSRKEGINFYLSVIGYKCGFDPGYFVFDGQNIQATTATQVRVTQKRTADTALSYRDVLDKPNTNGDGRVGAIHDIAYIINAMLVINGDVPLSDNGNYELFCSFADLLKNEEEDAAMDLQLANQGYMAKFRWLVLHRGYTEEDAKQMVQEAVEESRANAQDERLFGEE
ncbi:MAG: hypothetical protein HFH87_07140 [Lachnospiraceae bacterium]|nr:hypothetical protein [Lachnospiraceae bacterium]